MLASCHEPRSSFTARENVVTRACTLSRLRQNYSNAGGSDGKEFPCNAGDPGSIRGSGRSPGGGHSNPLQYPCLENPTDRGAWRGYSPWGCKESDVTEQLTLSRYSNALILQHEKQGARWPGGTLSLGRQIPTHSQGPGTQNPS